MKPALAPVSRWPPSGRAARARRARRAGRDRGAWRGPRGAAQAVSYEARSGSAAAGRPRARRRAARCSGARAESRSGSTPRRAGGSRAPRPPRPTTCRCATRSCASTSSTGDRAALAPLHRSQLRRLERRPRRSDAGRRPHRGRDGGRASTSNWKDANDTLRDAVRAEPRGTSARTSTGAGCSSRSTPPPTPRQSFRDVLELDPTSPTPTWPGARRARGALRRRRRRARAGARAGRQPAPRGRARDARRDGARRARTSRRARGRRGGDPAHQPARRRRGRASRRRRRCCSTIAPATRASATRTSRRPPARRRVLRVRRRGARSASAATTRRAPSPRRASRADAGDARCLSTLGTTLLRLGDETRRPRDAAPRLEARSLRRPHVQPAQPVREGHPRALHHRRDRAPALPRRAGGAARHRGGRRAVPRGDLPRYVERYGFEPEGPITFELYGEPAPLRRPHRRAAGHRRLRRLLRARDHLAGADQPRLQLGHGAGARAGARLRDRDLALARAALVHRGAVRARDDARAPRVEPARRRRAVGRAANAASCRRWSSCRTPSSTRATATTRCAPTRRPRWRWSSSSAASASRRSARRWSPTGAASAARPCSSA